MISIADVFDAMRSRRSYQEPRPMSQIESVLKGGAGKAFNPKLVDNIFRLIRMQPCRAVSSLTVVRNAGMMAA